MPLVPGGKSVVLQKLCSTPTLNGRPQTSTSIVVAPRRKSHAARPPSDGGSAAASEGGGASCSRRLSCEDGYRVSSISVDMVRRKKGCALRSQAPSGSRPTGLGGSGNLCELHPSKSEWQQTRAWSPPPTCPAMTSHQPRASSLSRRPTTPLRRLSSSSLRSTSLSHSRSRGASSVEPPLAHLNPVFAELADALSDLAGNFEALDQVNATLDGFNEAFGSYLYSLRVNAYTVDFDEGPTPINLERQRERLREEREREAALTQQQQTHERRHAEDGEEDGEQEGNETTFVTHESEYSFMHREEEAPRGGGARGRGRGRGRGGKPVGMTRRQKEVMLVRFLTTCVTKGIGADLVCMQAFSDSIIQLLPITFREQQVRHFVRSTRSGPHTASVLSIATTRSDGENYLGAPRESRRCC